MPDKHRVTDDELRQQIGAWLSEGPLPSVNGVSQSHRGTGRPCIVCRRAIEPTEVERQVGGLGASLFAHETCYKLWREESTAKSREEDERFRASHLRDLQATDPADEWPVSNRLGRRPRNIPR
jgi:hypothetical protein